MSLNELRSGGWARFAPNQNLNRSGCGLAPGWHAWLIGGTSAREASPIAAHRQGQRLAHGLQRGGGSINYGSHVGDDEQVLQLRTVGRPHGRLAAIVGVELVFVGRHMPREGVRDEA